MSFHISITNGKSVKPDPGPAGFADQLLFVESPAGVVIFPASLCGSHLETPQNGVEVEQQGDDHQ